MNRIRRYAAATALAGLMITAAPDAAHARGGGFNDEYVYATTKAVSHMDAHPGAKVPLYPITIAVDTAFLPFAVIAGFVTG